MPFAHSVETDPFRTRVVYDRSTERLRIAVDAVDGDADVSVAADSSRVRIHLERAGDVYDRTIPSPSHRRFTDDREAVFNNGVLTVRLETAPLRFSRAVGGGR
ncbi:Hsp20/alpha crystallin family protein [Natrialba sp. INN-245]|uniref:Hsp20/alpha crystallin family protein n=1 Tax=Natrialba sp. INN-245 TaxID=2690967 RepID=UPI001312EDD7|nr:Hsp20/alpha crystallin family protein [Natrialba sp. INN-245]MWV40744.1 Hsp20/alpha crystallin family protein [Natrialba sp. INN-245]